MPTRSAIRYELCPDGVAEQPHVPADPTIGIDGWADPLLVNYEIDPSWNLRGRVEYIGTSRGLNCSMAEQRPLGNKRNQERLLLETGVLFRAPRRIGLASHLAKECRLSHVK